jgi:glycosyltransferase involved in cell wall biosynthesis
MKISLNSKIKFIFLGADKFPPFRVDVSVLFGKILAGRGHCIDFILQSEKPIGHSYQTRWHNCQVLVGPALSGKSIIKNAANYILGSLHDVKILCYLIRYKYHMIIIKDKFVSAIFGLIASKVFRTKFIYWLSFPFPEASLTRVKDKTAKYPYIYFLRGHIFKIILYKILLPFADHVFVQTTQMKKNISKKGIQLEKMTEIPMAVDTDNIPFFGYCENHKNEEKDNIVVYLGTLVKFRRIDFILRSFKKVLNSLQNSKLILVGGSEDPSDELFIVSEAKKLEIIDSIIITGHLPQVEAWGYVKLADVCVSPIYPSPILDCGSPTKLLEYMAMGKAVVANNHSEQSMVISESKAGICVPYNEDAFASSILFLLKNPLTAMQMGIYGRQYIENRRNYIQAAKIVEKKLFEICKNHSSLTD